MSKRIGFLLPVTRALFFASSLMGQSKPLPNPSVAVPEPLALPSPASADETFLSEYVRAEKATIKRDVVRFRRDCKDALAAHRNPVVGRYDVFNDWVACGQDAFTGNALTLNAGMAPPGNGVKVGVKLTDKQALSPTVGSILQIDGDISYNATWTSYLYWQIIPRISNTFLEKPYIRIFTGSQKIQTLPYYGEGMQTSIANSGNYTFQRTAALGRFDISLAQTHLFEKSILFLQGGGHWYATGDASSLGISSVYTGSVPGSTGVVAYGEASLGTDLATKIYHTTKLYKHTDEIKAQISERVAPGSGGYSYRQLAGSWTHTLVRSCKQTQRIKLAGRANLSGGLNEESNFGHDILVDCFNVDLNGGIVASAAGAGNSVPFFLQPTVGGSDVNSNLTLPSYSDMRYRAPNAEFANVTLHRLIPTPWGLPLEAVFRTDTGKVAPTEGRSCH